jgi:hypothetical protein
MNEIVKRKPYIKYIIAGVVCVLFLIIIILLIYFLTRKKGIPFYLTYGDTGIWYSNDGMKWTNCSKEGVYDIAYNGVDTFLAVGGGNVFYSNDGKNWTLYASNIFDGGTENVGSFNVITYNGVDTWVVGAFSRTGNNLAYSNDGKKWTPVTNIFVGGWVSSIVYNGVDTWVAIGSGIGYSNDGKQWTQAQTGIPGSDVAYNGVDTWIAVGDGVRAHSTNGETWYTIQPSFKYPSDIVYNGVDTWVSVGDSPIMYSKNNGATWENGKGTTISGTSVAYNGIDTWVAVGVSDNQGSIVYSKDGALSWKKGTDIFSGGFGNSVAYNGVDTWVAVGTFDDPIKSIVAYSKDGIIWNTGTGINDDSNILRHVKIFTLK